MDELKRIPRYERKEEEILKEIKDISNKVDDIKETTEDSNVKQDCLFIQNKTILSRIKNISRWKKLLVLLILILTILGYSINNNMFNLLQLIVG